MTTLKKETIAQMTIDIRLALRNLNRVVSGWVKQSIRKNSEIKKIDIKDIMGLAKSEIIKACRGHIHSVDLNQVFGKAALFVEFDSTNGNIQKLTLGSLESFRNGYYLYTELVKILAALPYKESFYNANDYLNNEEQGNETKFDSRFITDFSALEAISF